MLVTTIRRWRKTACRAAIFAGAILVLIPRLAAAPPHPDSPGEGRRAPASAPSADRYAIVISVDGLMPASYAEADARGLKIPAMRELMAHGAWSPGVHDVMPAVTYPAHTTMVTGVYPRVHGIVTNGVFDPLGNRDGEWYWYESEIRVPTLWQIARAQGLRTAMISWPVTMGAQGDAVMPEFWRGRGIDLPKLLRAISTQGLWDATARRFPDFEKGFAASPVTDEAITDVALEAIESRHPNLLLLHLPGVDHQQHEHGPWSPEALAAIETADAQIGRVVEAARHAGIWPRTMFLVVSDHGFTRAEMSLRPGVILRQHGFITVDEKGHVASWRAAVAASAGSAYIYLHDPDDRETADAVRKLFDSLAAQPGSGIRRVLTPSDIAALGGDSNACLALEAADGFALVGGISGEPTGPAVTPGIHGFPPDREMMNSSLILDAPGVSPGKLDGARIIDIGPTVAHWLGLRLQDAEGKPLVDPSVPAASKSGD